MTDAKDKSRNHKAALLYASKWNLPVFPCEPTGKKPIGTLVKNGHLDATTDAKQIDALWNKEPNANVGIRLINKLIMDLDSKEDQGLDAYDTLNELQSVYGEFDKTPHVMTAGGGLHYWFNYEDKPFRAINVAFNNKGKGHNQPSGIDILSDGYVIAPPSMGQGACSYDWEAQFRIDEVEFAPAPDWLITLALNGSENADSTKAHAGNFWHEMLCNGIKQGGRNDSMTKVIASLLRRYVDPTLAWYAVTGINTTYCKPPIPTQELLKTFESITKKEAQRRQNARD